MTPRELVGLSDTKGEIAPGRDADLVVFDPDATFTVERHDASSPSQGDSLRGAGLGRARRGDLLEGPRGLSFRRFARDAMGPNASGRESEIDGSRFMNLELINAWTDDEARESFQRCCGSRRWSEAMARARPFESEAALIETAERIWWGLSKADWLEAFAAHPRIGDVDAIRGQVRRDRRLGEPRTGGRLGASEEVLQNLARGNRQYEERFGYIFIVCASGKTAEEMLELLMQRLGNDADAEIKLAAGEQMKITRIRLERIATS